MNETKDTQERLLDTSEKLFADNGIDSTSLRAITSEAGTNLASVHYHFGSKEALVEAVYARRLGPINEERLHLLDHLEAEGAEPLSLEAIIEAFVGPPIRVRHDPDRGGPHFACLIGRLYIEPSDLSHRIMHQFDEVFRRFTKALSNALQGLPASDLCWRFFFTIGSMSMPLVGPEVIQARSKGMCDASDVEETIRQLSTFLSAGLGAPASTPAGALR